MTARATRGYPGRMNHPGPILRELRERLGLSLATVAARLGVNRSTLSRWERAMQEPTYADVARWSAALGARADLLIRTADADAAELTPAQVEALDAVLRALPGLDDSRLELLRRLVGSW